MPHPLQRDDRVLAIELFHVRDQPRADHRVLQVDRVLEGVAAVNPKNRIRRAQLENCARLMSLKNKNFVCRPYVNSPLREVQQGGEREPQLREQVPVP